MSGLPFVDSNLVRTLEYELRRAFDAMVKANMFNGRGAMHVVALVPGCPYSENLSDAVLFEGRVVAPGGDYKDKYESIAMAKAKMALREKMDTRLIVTKPHLLKPGDVKYSGGVFACDTAIGVSGLRSQDDEFIGRWIAARIAALSLSNLEKFLTDQPETYFLS